MRTANVRDVIAACLTLVGAAAGPSAAGEDPRPVRYPADLGATAIDVSGYPPEHQRAYREIFVTKCGVCHRTARAVNAPFLELDPGDLSGFRAAHPEAVADREVLDASPDAWRRYVTRMWKRPPCCNLCPVFSKAEAEAVWRFLVYDSRRRKTGAALPEWLAYRKGLIDRYRHQEEEVRHEHETD